MDVKHVSENKMGKKGLLREAPIKFSRQWLQLRLSSQHVQKIQKAETSKIVHSVAKNLFALFSYMNSPPVP